MNAPSPWPSWLTTEHFRRLKDLSLTFTWMITNEATEESPSVFGQWARGLEQEINIALRADGDSFVGIYSRGQGFFQGARSPASATAETAHTGPFDDVLDLAVKFAAAREPQR